MEKLVAGSCCCCNWCYNYYYYFWFLLNHTTVTSSLLKKTGALDNWCLRRILHIHWTDFVSNEEVQTRTGQPFLSDTIRGRRLSFFRHLSQDHSRALQSCILGPPRDWHRRVGTPRQSWLRTVEDNLWPLISAWRQQSSVHWIDRHGGYSWRRLRLLDMLPRERKRDLRHCVVRAMYLSASEVAVSTWGAITNARPLPFTFYWCLAGDQSCSKGHAAHIKAKQPVMYAGRYISIRQVSLAGHCTFFASY